MHPVNRNKNGGRVVASEEKKIRNFEQALADVLLNAVKELLRKQADDSGCCI